MQHNHLIKPATYSKLRGLNRSTISRQIQCGAIPTHNGLIDPHEADQARQNNLSLSKRRKVSHLQVNTPSKLTGVLPLYYDPDREARRGLMDRILSKRNLVPAILAEIGVKDPVLIHASDDIFAALVCEFSGSLDPYNWDGRDDIPLVNTDLKPVFKQLNTKITAELVTQADKMADAVYRAIEGGQ